MIVDGREHGFKVASADEAALGPRRMEMTMASYSARALSASPHTWSRFAWRQKLVLAVTSLAFSACLNLTYPPNPGASGGSGGTRSDAKADADGPSPSSGGAAGSGGIASGGSVGSGGNVGSGGDFVNDTAGSGGVSETSTGGSGGLLGSGGGANADLAMGGGGGSMGSPDGLTVETGLGGSAGSHDGAANEDTAMGGSSGARDAPPEVTADVATDAAPDAANVLPTGLIAYYPCEKADGTNLTDMSGNGNHGTLHTATGNGGSSGSGFQILVARSVKTMPFMWSISCWKMRASQPLALIFIG